MGNTTWPIHNCLNHLNKRLTTYPLMILYAQWGFVMSNDHHLHHCHTWLFHFEKNDTCYPLVIPTTALLPRCINLMRVANCQQTIMSHCTDTRESLWNLFPSSKIMIEGWTPLWFSQRPYLKFNDDWWKMILPPKLILYSHGTWIVLSLEQGGIKPLRFLCCKNRNLKC